MLLVENIHPSAREMFAPDGFQVEMLPAALKEAELKERIKDVHILGIRSKTHVTKEVLGEARRLLALGCFCIGTNQVDVGAAQARGVPVFNAPFSNTRSVAEMILAEVVMLARQLGDRSREVHEGKWRKVAVGSFEIRGKTLGIIGYGHIGTQIGVLAESFGMRVLFFDIATRMSIGNNRSVDSLEDLLQQSDFVTLHVPATPQTKGMIGKAEIARMRAGSYLLNASRGQVVDIAALAGAIREKHIAGAAIDVFPEEPESNNEEFASELRGLPNVILTPHIGGSTEEAQESIGREVAISLSKFVNAGATIGAVNFPQVELPQTKGTHRILNVHRNVPGVLRDINKIVSDRNANIHSQVLSTDPAIGYLLMDLDDNNVSDDVCQAIAALSTNIKTRINY
ncbi:MAG: D-3-phosphoglycerate dehydrogenase [Myxococcaceae bacterium]|nr:D-3-phosphoglycerate dehydrogenase [Myxococcaceae bacterium]